MKKLSAETIVKIFEMAVRVTLLFQDRTVITNWDTAIDVSPEMTSISFHWKIDGTQFSVSWYFEPYLLFVNRDFYLESATKDVCEQIRKSIMDTCFVPFQEPQNETQA